MSVVKLWAAGSRPFQVIGLMHKGGKLMTQAIMIFDYIKAIRITLVWYQRPKAYHEWQALRALAE